MFGAAAVTAGIIMEFRMPAVRALADDAGEFYGLAG